MRRVVLVLCVVLLASAAQGIVLQISVNGDPTPADSEIYLLPSEELILDIHSPSGHSGSSADDVYWILVVDPTQGSIAGGVVIACGSLWAPYIWPCEPGICENGLFGAIVAPPGGTCPPGVYVDDIIFHGEGVSDATIELYTTQDFGELTLQDRVLIHLDGITDCLKATAPEYADWVAFGMPDCWCYRYQCRGDIDGVQTGPFWVAIPDLTLFKAAFNRVVIPEPPGVCADLDHAATGPFRCGIPDLTIFKSYHGLIVLPQCDQEPIYTGPYNWWTN
ncbi:MAG: hypothetical protein ACYST6_01870 [Planctomycetota bacterium]